MTPSDIQILIGSIAGLLAVVAGGAKWLLTHIETLQIKYALTESGAREKLSDRLHEEIRVLRMQLVDQQLVSRLYLRRIYQLEGFIHRQPGISIPDLDGWPPV